MLKLSLSPKEKTNAKKAVNKLEEGKLTEYSEGKLWYLLEGDTLTVGITQIGIEALGTVQDIELPEVGDSFESGDWVGEVRGKNADVALSAPAAFEIQEINEEVRNEVSLVEEDPTGDAWILRGECIKG